MSSCHFNSINSVRGGRVSLYQLFYSCWRPVLRIKNNIGCRVYSKLNIRTKRQYVPSWVGHRYWGFFFLLIASECQVTWRATVDSERSVWTLRSPSKCINASVNIWNWHFCISRLCWYYQDLFPRRAFVNCSTSGLLSFASTLLAIGDAAFSGYI